MKIHPNRSEPSNLGTSSFMRYGVGEGEEKVGFAVEEEEECWFVSRKDTFCMKSLSLATMVF